MEHSIAHENVTFKGFQVNSSNRLIQHLQKEDGTMKKLFVSFINSEGDIAKLPILVDLESLAAFIGKFADRYIIFRDENTQLLFEVSDGLLCYVTQDTDINIKREDVREILYSIGIKNIS